MIQYIVQPGDSLYTIGARFKTDVCTLMNFNRIADPCLIYPGQILGIPLHQSAAASAGCFPAFQKNSSGPLVALLQSRLARLGFYQGPIDGTFSAAVKDSLIRFQLSRNLHPAGQADANTWRLLLDDINNPSETPPCHADMLLSGLFMVLSLDKPAYQPGEIIRMSLTKINLSGRTITMNYRTSQRYDFKITYPSGLALWRWSDDKSFTQVLGRLSLAPGQVIRYTESFNLSSRLKSGIYHVFGWNTSNQLSHVKQNVMIRIQQDGSEYRSGIVDT